MSSRSALLVLLLAISVCSCCAEETTSVKPDYTLKEADTLEIAIVLAGVLAATTVLVAIVLGPTVLYHNYRSKQEMDAAPPVTLH